MTSAVDWIAGDWGTSNLRLWGIDSKGDVLFARNSARGMGTLSRADYPMALNELLADVPLPPRVEVLICGMAGARQGWVEAPYVEAPTDLASLATSTVSVHMGGADYAVRILPGVCQRAVGAEDVMRGEETQLLGLSSLLPGFSGLVVMPGTHSKWVILQSQRVERFSTAMTGELFNLLKTQSVLRYAMTGADGGWEQSSGIKAGLAVGLRVPQRLTAKLFEVRAASLLSDRGPGWCEGYLSGLLIGTEIGAQKEWITGEEVPLVGSSELCQIYATGLAELGVKTRVVDAMEATLAGLKRAKELN